APAPFCPSSNPPPHTVQPPFPSVCFVADVGCELLYRNEEPGPVEAVFVFPVDAEAAVYAFQARLGGACIKAQLHEKKEVPGGRDGTKGVGYGYTLARGQGNLGVTPSLPAGARAVQGHTSRGAGQGDVGGMGNLGVTCCLLLSNSQPVPPYLSKSDLEEPPR
uniref:VIT domain-containing protein n=1 Tax=Chrysemys picta bellii TaxID=8478 RepID=A0A8C3FMB1_CHRPI